MLIFASKLGVISISVVYIVGGWVQKGKKNAYVIKEWPLSNLTFLITKLKIKIRSLGKVTNAKNMWILTNPLNLVEVKFLQVSR